MWWCKQDIWNDDNSWYVDMDGEDLQSSTPMKSLAADGGIRFLQGQKWSGLIYVHKNNAKWIVLLEIP